MRFVVVLMFQEFPFHEEERWPYNPGMAPVDGHSSQVTPAPDARHVVDAIPGLAWSSRPDGSVEFFNGRWYEYTGLSLEESFGWGWKAAVHGEDVARLLDRWATRDAEGGRECEVRLRRSDGDFQWFLLRHEPLCDPTGAVVRWYGTWINIEDSKQKELLGVAGKRALEMIAAGAGISEILNELSAAIDVYVSAVSQVLLMDSAGHQLLPLAGPNFPSALTAALAPWPVGSDRGCCGTAAATGKRVIISDMSTDPRWPRGADGEAARKLVLDHGLRAAWSEPLISNSGEVLGTFCIGYSQPRVPTSRDLQLIEAAGHIARITIERHQSQEALTRAHWRRSGIPRPIFVG